MSAMRTAEGLLEFPQNSGYPKYYLRLSKTPTIQKQDMISYFGYNYGPNHRGSFGFYKFINNPLFRSHSISQKRFFSYAYNHQTALFDPDVENFITDTKTEGDGKLYIDADSINDINPLIEEGFIVNVVVDFQTDQFIAIPVSLHFNPDDFVKK